MFGRYRKRLRAAIGASAAPYGYTLAVWTSGTALIRSHGIPGMTAALAFMVGAVAGFALVGTLAFGGPTRRLDTAPVEATSLWGSLHFFSVGAAIVAVTLVAQYVQGFAAWPLGGFLITTTYLIFAGAESAAAHEWDQRSRR